MPGKGVKIKKYARFTKSPATISCPVHLDLAAPELRLLRGGVNDEGQWADERDGELLAEGVVVDPGAEACWLIIGFSVLSVNLTFKFTLLKN